MSGLTGWKEAALVEVDDDRAWDTLVARCPEGDVFHRTDWLRVAEDVYATRAVRLGIEVGGELVAGLPLFLRRKGPFTVAGSPLHTAMPQMGPISRDPAWLPALLASFDIYQQRQRIAYAHVIFPGPIDRRLLEPYHYQIDSYRTLVLDLAGRNRDDLWRGMTPQCRGKVRRAEELGVKIEILRDLSFLPDYLRMVDAIFTRHGGRPPIPASWYPALWSRFSPTGELVVMAARHEGQAVSIGFSLVSKNRLFGLTMAAYPGAYALAANNLWEWALIQWALEQGLDLYDMVGAGLPGIARFKRSFGTRPVELTRIRRTNSRLASVARQARSRSRPLRRLPAALGLRR